MWRRSRGLQENVVLTKGDVSNEYEFYMFICCPGWDFMDRTCQYYSLTGVWELKAYYNHCEMFKLLFYIQIHKIISRYSTCQSTV